MQKLGADMNDRKFTKSMELLKLYSQEKTSFFCLIKLLFIKVRCLINVNVSLEANIEGQGW